jgi:hypothetical protein
MTAGAEHVVGGPWWLIDLTTTPPTYKPGVLPPPQHGGVVVAFAPAGLNDLRWIVGLAIEEKANCPPTQQCRWTDQYLAIPVTSAPAITIAATPDTLWPPNGKLVPVTVSGTITDKDSNVDAITATYQVKDESGLIQPSGAVSVRLDGHYTFTIDLEASRKGNDPDGRQYTITVRAVDDEGNEGSATAIVTVPHDLGQGRSSAAR